MSVPAPGVRIASLRGALARAAVLFVADALFLNQGAIAFLVAVWVVLVGFPRALLASKFAGLRAQRARNLAIYLAAAVLVWPYNRANNVLARERAEGVIAAVKSYHADNQRYPARLDELVPRYLDSVPLAKYTLVFNQFTYLPAGEAPLLQFVGLPPFGRPTYFFASGRWGYVD